VRLAFACAFLACGLAACRYDYDALMGTGRDGSGAGGGAGAGVGGRGGGGGSTGPGAAGNSGSAGGGGGGDGGEGAGAGTGGGGTVGSAGTGGSSAGGTGARGGTGGAGGLAGTGGGAGVAGRGGAGGGTGGTAGRGGAGGSGGSTGGASGRGGAGGASGRGGTGGGGAGGASGSGGTGGGTAGTGGGGGAVGGGGGSGGSPDADLVLWYKFDDGTGTVALDSSTVAGAPRNGMLVTAGSGGAVAFSTMHQIGTYAISLTANGSTGGGYVTVPSLNDIAPGAVTLSAWVNVSTAQQWQRVFDLGTSTTSNLALTTHNGSNAVRFIIRNGTVSQEIASNVTLSTAAWHHLAVVLPEGATYTGQLYVDGVSVATNTAMTLHAADLGATTSNFIGKSEFSADPYFSGLIDDFRVYRRALTAAEIAALYAAR